VKYLSKHEIVGRGLTLCMEMEKGDGTIQIGDWLPHDGKVYEVCGIEMSRIMTSPTILSNKVGFLVKEVGTKTIQDGKYTLCGACQKVLPKHFTYTHCPFCGVKIDGGIDCRKGEEKK